ncbi:MAG: Fe-S cluster assembly protein NifU [Thermodesulfovibrionales bacterium]|nr:Fe-S cluster assembly protein NifU [Thermodesulfovibrionales bacterium]
MWEYTKKVKEFFLHPKNVGEIENPDAVGEVGSLICGDALKLYLKIDKETGKIIDAKFQTFGCASAIASSSALTELIKGKTLDEAMLVGNQDIAEYLGGLPKEKMHCSVMGREALEAAIANYKGEKPPKEEEKIICKCFEVSEEKIRRTAIENHLTTVEDVTNFTKAGGGCGACIPAIEAILKDVWAVKVAVERQRIPKKMTNLQKIALIQDVIEKEIRPALQADGGDIELIDVEGDRVIVALRAMCVSCPMGGITLEGIQKKLRELVSEDIIVETE